MADVTVSYADVRALPGCIIRRFTAGGTIAVGEPVYLSANNTVARTAGTALAMAQCIGVVIARANGGTSIASGEEVDVVLFGPVAGYSTNMAVNTLFYVDDDAGVIATAAGTKDFVIGIGLSGAVLLVRPQQIDFS